MPTLAPRNTDLPSSWMIPGVFIQLNLAGSGAGLNNPQKRLLLLGQKTSSGTKPVDAPFQVFTQSDCNGYFGQGSDLARMYAAVISQIGSGAADIFCQAVGDPIGGTAATHLITFIGTATSTGYVDMLICGYRATVAIAGNDTATAIATNAATAINAIKDLPVTASSASGTVTLTARSVGLGGNDLPVIVNQYGAGGITVSPGTVTITGPATGSGTVSVTIGAVTITATVNNSDSANTIATNLAAAINAGNYPVTASAATSVVTLLYATDQAVHRISAAATATGVTATAAVGTAGAGTPTLTTSLANLAALSGFKIWCTSFNDTSSLGALAAHIESMADGLNQKGQRLHVGSTDSLTTAGAIPTGTTPTLTSSPRYAVIWHPDSPQQAYELAARSAAIRCVQDYAADNYDGMKLKTSGTVPLLVPTKVRRPSVQTVNSALYSQYLTPIVVDDSSGSLRIVRARTTSNAADDRIWDWALIDTLDYYRFDLAIYLNSLFGADSPGGAKNIKLASDPKTPNCVSVDDVKDAIISRIIDWDNADLFDGAASLASQVTVNPDPYVSTRLDAGIPARPPRNLHQIAPVLNQV